MNWIENILQVYGLEHVHYYPVTDRLYRITDGEREYALKQSTLTENTIDNWQSLIRLANDYNMDSFLPVYVTREQEVCVSTGGNYFYLTPWVAESRKMSEEQSIQSFYKTIAIMHRETKQTEEIKSEGIIEIAKFFQSASDRAAHMLLEEVQTFEQERYMSPFGLLVCTQYRDVSNAIQKCKETADQLATMSEADTIFQTCINHGNLRLSHWVSPYLVNWERAYVSSPVSDLTTFFFDVLEDGHPDRLYIDAFSAYMDENKLTDQELQLLSIYLLNPRPYLSIMKAYREQKTITIPFIKQLQHAYRKLMFGLSYWQYCEERQYEKVANEEDL